MYIYIYISLYLSLFNSHNASACATANQWRPKIRLWSICAQCPPASPADYYRPHSADWWVTPVPASCLARSRATLHCPLAAVLQTMRSRIGGIESLILPQYTTAEQL